MTAALSWVEVATAQELDDRLAALNFDEGIDPVVVGFDANGVPFLAYGWAPGGDGWSTGVVTDDPHSNEFDYMDVERCQECGAFGRRSLDALRFPVLIAKREA